MLAGGTTEIQIMNHKPTAVRWRILMILILASFVSYVLRSNLSIAAPAMIEDLGLTEIQWGWILAAFTAGYAIFQFPGGVFGDKFGPRRALTLIAILWAVLTVVTTLVPGQDTASVGIIIGALLVVRFLTGAAHAPIFPTMNNCIQRWFPVGGWAFPTGLTSTGLTLGFAATAPVLAWMIAQYGWRLSFNVFAPFGLLVAALWWWYSRDKPEEHPAVNAGEVAIISADRPEAHEDEDAPPAWFRVLKNRDVLLLTISYFCMCFVFYDAFNWFYYYLVTVRGFGVQEAGMMTATQWVAGGAGAALGGWFCDRLCHRFGLRWGCRWPVVAGMVISGLLLIGGSVTGNAHVAVVMLALCFFFNQLTEGAYWGTSIAIGGAHAGAAGGVLNTGGNVMGIVNALAVPMIAHHLGWTVAMATGGVFALVGAVLMLLVRADRPFDAD